MATEQFSSDAQNDVVNKHKESNSDVSHNTEGTPILNGFSNGISSKHKEHKSHREDKERSKDKDRHRDKDKHRDRDRDRDRDKDKHRDKDREHKSSSSSHKSKDKDRDRDREKDKHRDKERERDKDKENKHRDEKKEHKNRDKDSSSSKHGSSSSKPQSSSSPSKEKHGSSSLKDKDKERIKEKEKDREKEKERDKDKERDKEKQRDKEKDKERSDKDKDKSKHSSDKDKNRDKSKDKDKERHKEKHRDKERDKEKHRDKDKHKDGKDKEAKRSSEEKKRHTDDTPPKESVKKNIFMDDSDFTPIKKPAPEPKVEVKQEPEDYDNSYEEESQLRIVEDESDDDVPLAQRKSSVKREIESDDEDDLPLSARKKVKKEKPSKKRKKQESDDDEEDFKPVKAKPKKSVTKVKTEIKSEAEESPRKKKKKEEEQQEVWKWWEEEKKPDGVKWSFLEHKGPVFAPPYEPLPSSVKFYYNGKEMKLSQDAEEVATFYAKMLEHDYTTKDVFNNNFFADWRSVMTHKEKDIIKDLELCNFKDMHRYFVQKSEERKAMSKEEKKKIKEQNDAITEEYGFCIIDGHKEKIGNFRIEPPGLFRGRGEHPKMGKLKRRAEAEDIIINCSKGSKVPVPPPGHKWKEVRHDNTVTWLASWTENVQGQVKYIMLNPSSKLKGEKDWQKYETARKLAHSIEKIRNDYREDWKSKEMRIRQRAVAMYFIDKLALRAGNEKDEDQADTVGCCSLRVEHIELFPEKDGKEYVVVFDFLGKDSIRYYNEVPVEKRVFKNLQLFVEGKQPNDDLFDRLNTQILNKHLSDLMEGLTAKVFRTYNASFTLQQQLKELTDPSYSVPEMILAYNRANRAVAILCNHQRSVPKSHQKSMENLKEKIAAKKQQIEDMEKQVKIAKKEAKHGSVKEKVVADKKSKQLERLREQLTKLEVQETDREENKTIALGTSKLNYLDPRISVAWCKKYNIPIDKIYNKTQREKFRWAIDMATADYEF